MRLNEISHAVIGSAIEVHRQLGPGLIERVYEMCLAQEMTLRGLRYESQVQLPIVYRDVTLDRTFRMDFVVEEAVVVEIKAVDELSPVHEAQLLTYLRLSRLQLGLLINFNVARLRHGIRRRANALPPQEDLRALRASAPPR